MLIVLVMMKYLFGKGDLCINIYDMTKTCSDFPLGFYNGLEIFIDVDMANDYVKQYIPDFDLIEFYELLKKSQGYVLLRSNNKIDHVIGELYHVDNRIKLSYFKLNVLNYYCFSRLQTLMFMKIFPLPNSRLKLLMM